MPFKFKFDRNVRWLVVSVICCTVLAAFPIFAQQFDAKLYEPVATLWGSALGALAGVSGAFWVADRQRAQQQQSAAALVGRLFHPTTFALDELAFVFGAPAGPRRPDLDDEPEVFQPERWKEIAEYAERVCDHFDAFKKRIHRYEAGLNLLSADSLSTALALEQELEDAIRDAVIALQRPPQEYDVESSSVKYIAKAPSWNHRFAILVFNRDVQDYMAKLERAS